MNVKEINKALGNGLVNQPGLFPHLEQLKNIDFVFKTSFGLERLPKDAGIITIRGARQSGKSTWLEGQLRSTVRKFGAGSAFYLNGDEIRDVDQLVESIRELLPLYKKGVSVRRLFVDEITAIENWQRGIKRLADAGELRKILVITTGSKATDLRRGTERLPGRKGKLARSSYLFLPVSYREFHRVCGKKLKSKTFISYLISGGAPLACSEIAANGVLPEYLITMVRDWIYGECAASRRDRSSLLALMEVVFRFGGKPVGQAKLARETGMANNTVAAGYIELLSDLLCLAPSYAWDESRKVLLRRRPYKVHFINLLAAVAWHPANIRTVFGFNALSPQVQGTWLEWLVAQELWRRSAKRGEEVPEELKYWQSKEHELDFVLNPTQMIEVKRGPSSPMEFSWFPRTFPGKSHLSVLNQKPFSTERIEGLKIEDWLLAER